MSYIINDACISCGACEPECPVECISAGDDKYVIDESVCIECGACVAKCPIGISNLNELSNLNEKCKSCMNCLIYNCPIVDSLTTRGKNNAKI